MPYAVAPSGEIHAEVKGLSFTRRAFNFMVFPHPDGRLDCVTDLPGEAADDPVEMMSASNFLIGFRRKYITI